MSNHFCHSRIKVICVVLSDQKKLFDEVSPFLYTTRCYSNTLKSYNDANELLPLCPHL